MQTSPLKVNGKDVSPVLQQSYSAVANGQDLGPIDQDFRRTERLRDNKRRNRQRQRDYTASLESRLRELEAKGVQATQEVQVSARKVVEDNARLKALLRHLGVSDIMIETWNPTNPVKSIREIPSCKVEREGICARENQHPDMELTRLPPVSVLHKPKCSLSQSEPPSILQKSGGNKRTDHKVDMALDDESTIQPTTKTQQLPPCKVLTRLAEDPSLDITQPVTAGPDPTGQESGGVDCIEAHDMLMQLATTEEKLNIISLALEQGCIGKLGGGCKVRNEALWKAIDDVT